MEGDSNVSRPSTAFSCLATFKNRVRCLGGISKCCASNSAIWREGRRSSDSIFKISEMEQPTRRASSCCVISNALRRRRTQFPKLYSEVAIFTSWAELAFPERNHLMTLHQRRMEWIQVVRLTVLIPVPCAIFRHGFLNLASWQDDWTQDLPICRHGKCPPYPRAVAPTGSNSPTGWVMPAFHVRCGWHPANDVRPRLSRPAPRRLRRDR